MPKYNNPSRNVGMLPLFIIAGASCSGKTTLLEQWKSGRANPFEDLFASGSHSSSSFPRGDQITQLGFIQLYQQAKLMQRPEGHIDGYAIHVNLSLFFKQEFRLKGGDNWNKNIGQHYESEDAPGSGAIKTFWELLFKEDPLAEMIRQSFTSCAIATLLCKREIAKYRKIQRDSGKLQQQNPAGSRQRALFDKLYSDSPIARKNYNDHYLGWFQFVNSLNTLPVQHLLLKGD